ncbi:MAG: ribonuclease Z [Bacillota bacterium]
MEPVKLIILGSGSIIPTPERGHAAIWLESGKNVFLWDCGEGTQRQLQGANLSYMKINKIFITHWHADHFAGLPGLLETLSLSDRKEDLQIIGPEADRFTSLILKLTSHDFKYEVNPVNTNFEEQNENIIINEEKYTISSVPAQHSIPAVAYCFQQKDSWNIDIEKAVKYGLSPGPKLGEIKKQGEIIYKGKKIKLEEIADFNPGKKIVYSGDTSPSPAIEKLAQNADILIHDATFLNESSEKHSTVKEAAELALRAGVKKLVLTHYSRRYKDINYLKERAQDYFNNVIIARDLMKIKV